MQRRTLLQTAALATMVGAAPRWTFAGAPADLSAVTGDGKPITITAKLLTDLRASLRGKLLLAEDPGYEQARQVINPVIDRRPALIIQPAGVADVRSAVNFARSLGLLVAVKCGGHSFSGQSTCNGGMQIDLSAMRGVRVDPQRRRAWVAGGTLLGAIDHEAMAFGLVTPLGTVSHTGVGGLTTGGGFGRMARRFGLALDNVTAVDIVTADGVFRRASAKDNADLYWAVRGGGGNFGIITDFEFQLHPVERQVIGGTLVFPIERARDVLSRYAEYTPRAPDELYLDAWFASPAGRPQVCGINVCYSGPARDFERAMAPIRNIGTPVADRVAAVDYDRLQRASDQSDARSEGNYSKNGFVSSITVANVKDVLAGFGSDARRTSIVYFQHAGGAIGRVATNATAFPHRHAQANMMVMANWPVNDDAKPHIEWARQCWKTLEPYTHGFYVNEVEGNEGAAVLNANYLGNYPRLARIKQQYDPGNLFRLNANITPVGKTIS